MHQPASLNDVKIARTVIGRAFATDPLMEWVFPEPDERAGRVATWLGFALEYYAEHGVIELAGDPAVAASAYEFRPPSEPTARVRTLPTFGGLLRSLIGPERTDEVRFALAETAKLGPAEPHVYLQFLAVDPEAQGGGHGGRLIRSCLAAAESRGLPIKLETHNEVNIDIYLHFGFEVVDQMQMGTDGPISWTMWRPRS